ncbi:MAG: hypothetical protein KA369_01395 [Spirochaetes bacterium]|nr:hypothetical protein [Spirochaetota bacterium]
MNCETIQQRFIEMDNRSRIPLSVQIHMLHCHRCRHDIAMLTERFEALREEAPFMIDRDLCEQIMREVFRSKEQYEHHVSGLQWWIVGSILFISLFAIPFSNSFGWLRNYFGAGLEVPLSIVLGLGLSIYALVGIFSNMENLKKFVDNLPKRMH